MKFTTSSTAAIAVSAAIPAHALNLVKRDEPRVVAMQIHRRTENKIFTSPSLLRKRAKTVSQTLDNFEDGSLYFANVTMGTPAQNFRFHIDTGSSDLWTNVANSRFCQSDTSDPRNQGIPCSVSGTYAANDSSTYKYINSRFAIQYADGSEAAGDYVSDTVRMGGADLANQQFGVGYTSSSSEGVMGIGYIQLEASYQNARSARDATTYPNIPQSMVDQGYISTNAYSLWLDDIYSSTGNILFGGVDSDKYQGSLRTLDIVPEDGGYFEMLVTLNDVTFTTGSRSTQVLSSSTTVLLDSGSTISYLPDAAAQAIYEAVGAQYSSRYGLAFTSCDLANSTDTLAFDFSGKTITVAMSEMVLEGGPSQSLDCTFGIAPQSSISSSVSNTPCVLGDSFIRNAYIVYDLSNNQISLAQTNNKATTSNILEISSGKSGVPDVTGSAAPAATSLSNGGENVQPATASGTSPGSSATGSTASGSSSSAFAAATGIPMKLAGAAGLGVAVAAILL